MARQSFRPRREGLQGTKGFEVEVNIGEGPDKSKPLDVDAFLGDAKGKVPAFFAPFKPTTSRDDALVGADKAGPHGKVDS